MLQNCQKIISITLFLQIYNNIILMFLIDIVLLWNCHILLTIFIMHYIFPISLAQLKFLSFKVIFKFLFSWRDCWNLQWMHLVGNNVIVSVGIMVIAFKHNWSIRHNWLIICGGVKVHKMAGKVHNLNIVLT